MRITGGKVRGRLLAAVKGYAIRPTSDRVREAIFDLVGHQWDGKRVLDLFAGTGSLGLEALSRGASEVLFVDYSSHALKLLRKNIERCGFAQCSKIMRRDLRRAPPGTYPFGKDSFHLVFMDPPYRQNLIPPAAGRLVRFLHLSSGALLVAECSKNEILPSSMNPFVMSDARTYGDTKITIYTYEVSE
jgi:16S rRNA (guanine966-N2)-methyltransferase